MSLRFAYQPDPLKSVPAIASPPGVLAVRYVPAMPVRLYHPRLQSVANVGSALVDTGSDFTIIRHLYRSILGITSSDEVGSINHRWQGNRFPMPLVRLEIEIFDGQNRWRWPAIVGLTQAPIPYQALLGHTGFLEFMTAQFDGEDHVLRLTTNGLFLQVGGAVNA